MALTLAEAAELTQDVMLRGIIETIIQESRLLQLVPFETLNGTALTYNIEEVLAAVEWLDVGDSWTEDTPDFDQLTAVLRILGGDADVDNFLQKTYANPNDLEAEIIASKAKSMAYEWSDTFYTGDNSANSRQPDGLAVLVPAGQTLEVGTNGGPVTLELLDEFIDLVKPGRPEALMMAKRTRREINILMRASGQQMGEGRDMFGQRALFYDDIPIVVDDFIPIDETQGTAMDASSIYAAKFGRQGLISIQNGGITVERVGELETKDATRTRIKWYVGGPVILASPGVARLQGVIPPS